MSTQQPPLVPRGLEGRLAIITGGSRGKTYIYHQSAVTREDALTDLHRHRSRHRGKPRFKGLLPSPKLHLRFLNGADRRALQISLLKALHPVPKRPSQPRRRRILRLQNPHIHKGKLPQKRRIGGIHDRYLDQQCRDRGTRAPQRPGEGAHHPSLLPPSKHGECPRATTPHPSRRAVLTPRPLRPDRKPLLRLREPGLQNTIHLRGDQSRARRHDSNLGPRARRPSNRKRHKPGPCGG